MDAINKALNRRPNPHKFHPTTSIPPLTNRIILVTGGNAGIGFQTVLQLSLHQPQRIYLACRSRAKYDAAMAELLKSNPQAESSVKFLELDLGSLESVKAAATKVLEENERLDILINNAGIMGAPAGQTKDGYEVHFGVNYLGHAALTCLLLPLLQRTAKRTDVEQGSVRVVNVTSMAYGLAPNFKGKDGEGIDTSEMTLKSDGRGKHGFIWYGVTKLANVWFTNEAARRWGGDHGDGVVSVSVHPGRVQTALLDDFFGREKWNIWWLVQKGFDTMIGPMGQEEGAMTQLWAATAAMARLEAGKEVKQEKRDGVVNGAFYTPIGIRQDVGNKKLSDEVGARKLWEWMEGELRKHDIE